VLVKVSKELIDECKEFARLRVDDSESCYRRRGEARKQKMQLDIQQGTIAEWAVYNLLVDKALDVNEPDMTIHKIKNKSFGPDLSDGKLNFHVKTQPIESSKRYGYSWLFQKTDKVFINPTDNDFLVLTSSYFDQVEIMGIIKIKDLVEGCLISAPKVPRYQYTKVAIYYDEICDSNVTLWRF